LASTCPPRIKPNLTNSSPPPVTTNLNAAEAVYNYCKAHTKAEIIIGEGTGSGKTAEVFTRLGYTSLPAPGTNQNYIVPRRTNPW